MLAACVLALAALLTVPLAKLLPASADVEADQRAAVDVAALSAGAPDLQRSVSMDMPSLQQNPELPTGCESVSLTNTLVSFGFDLQKTDIADDWLPRSSSDFVSSFMGDPHSTTGNSCMAPAIVRAASSYLGAQNSSMQAFDLTGDSFQQLLGEVSAGHPVIAWCTIGLQDPGMAYGSQRENGRVYRLFPNSHTVVVRGYDLDQGLVFVSDPLAGLVSYDLLAFAERYYQMGSQAVEIK